MSPTGGVHHLRPTDVTLVGDVVIGLQNPLERSQKQRRAFAAAVHAKIEDRRSSRSPVLPPWYRRANKNQAIYAQPSERAREGARRALHFPNMKPHRW